MALIPECKRAIRAAFEAGGRRDRSEVRHFHHYRAPLLDAALSHPLEGGSVPLTRLLLSGSDPLLQLFLRCHRKPRTAARDGPMRHAFPGGKRCVDTRTREESSPSPATSLTGHGPVTSGYARVTRCLAICFARSGPVKRSSPIASNGAVPSRGWTSCRFWTRVVPMTEIRSRTTLLVAAAF